MKSSPVCCVAKEGRCDTSGQGQQDTCNFLNMNDNFFHSFTLTCRPLGRSFLFLFCFLQSKIKILCCSGYGGYRLFLPS